MSLECGGKAAALLFVATLFACQSTHPTGAPMQPIAASTPDQALQKLNAIDEAKALMRIRLITPEKTQSFTAQLQLGKSAMTLIAYTPLNTTAMRVHADERGVEIVNELEHTTWHGTPAEFGAKFGFFGAVTPHDMARLMIGLPAASPDVRHEATAAGLARATAGDVVVTYDPPSFPPSRVTIVRGAQRVEIVVNEVVESR